MRESRDYRYLYHYKHLAPGRPYRPGSARNYFGGHNVSGKSEVYTPPGH